MTAKKATSTETRGNAGCSTQPDGWINADVTTLVQEWASAKVTRGHMGLRASDESVVAQWKRVNSANATSNPPKPVVNYNYRPRTGTKQEAGAPFFSYSGAYVVNTVTPTLRDTFVDPNGDKVNGTFQIFDSATNTQVGNVIVSPLGELGTGRLRDRTGRSADQWQDVQVPHLAVRRSALQHGLVRVEDLQRRHHRPLGPDRHHVDGLPVHGVGQGRRTGRYLHRHAPGHRPQLVRVVPGWTDVDPGHHPRVHRGQGHQHHPAQGRLPHPPGTAGRGSTTPSRSPGAVPTPTPGRRSRWQTF